MPMAQYDRGQSLGTSNWPTGRLEERGCDPVNLSCGLAGRRRFPWCPAGGSPPPSGVPWALCTGPLRRSLLCECLGALKMIGAGKHAGDLLLVECPHVVVPLRTFSHGPTRHQLADS